MAATPGTAPARRGRTSWRPAGSIRPPTTSGCAWRGRGCRRPARTRGSELNALRPVRIPTPTAKTHARQSLGETRLRRNREQTRSPCDALTACPGKPTASNRGDSTVVAKSRCSANPRRSRGSSVFATRACSRSPDQRHQFLHGRSPLLTRLHGRVPARRRSQAARAGPAPRPGLRRGMAQGRTERP